MFSLFSVWPLVDQVVHLAGRQVSLQHQEGSPEEAATRPVFPQIDQLTFQLVCHEVLPS